MSRQLRIEYPGAIYHAMSRGNERQDIFRSSRDYSRFLEGLDATVDKYCFEIFSFVCMPNHFHLFLRTPEPNLSQGMQYLLSGYAGWFNTRHDRVGHLFQGRFKGELIEEESYFWNVSRYIHLNPVRGERPLVRKPEEWPWSSFPGYCWNERRMPWVNYDAVLDAWQGRRGGGNPAKAYREFVAEGVSSPPESPFHRAKNGWLLGSDAFVRRITKQLDDLQQGGDRPLKRRDRVLTVSEVVDAVAIYYRVDASAFAKKHARSTSRDVAAWLARRLTTATLEELSEPFGLGHPESVRELIKRADATMANSPQVVQDVHALKAALCE